MKSVQTNDQVINWVTIILISFEPGSTQTLLPQQAFVKTKEKKWQTADLFFFFF